MAIYNSKGTPRGVTDEESRKWRQQAHRMRQDPRSTSAQMADFFTQPEAILVVAPMMMLLGLLVPAMAIIVPVGFAAYSVAVLRARRYERLPLRLPMIISRMPHWFSGLPGFLRRILLLPDMAAPVTDYNSPIPGRKSFAKARGGIHMGNEEGTNYELWQSPQDFLTHMLLLGTTGAGKTEALVSMFYSALSTGAGGAYTDAKASPKLAMQIFQILRFLGRDDDFRIISYFTSQTVKAKGTPDRISNTNNMFAFGPAELLTQLLTSLIPSSSGDNAIFSQNAETLASALMYPLVWRRDNLKQPLSISVIRAHLNLQRCVALATDNELPESMRLPLKSFLAGVGWQQDKLLDGQPRSLPEQFGYARGYFNLALAQLTDTYGHIHDTDTGEIDMADIITQRRVMVTMLPALQKSPEQLGMLGKIILSGQRNAAAVGLGARVEGTSADVLDNLPVDTSNIFLAVTDEYGAIPTPGYAEILTQGRGLGIGAIIASQDASGIMRGDEHAYKQIAENTTMKFIMRVESALDTWTLVSGVAGEQEVFRTQGMKLGGENNASMSMSYQSSRDITIDKANRVVLQDFQEQIEGEFHLFSRGRLIRGRVFHADPPLENRQLRIHRMLPYSTPDPKALNFQYGPLQKLREKLICLSEAENPWGAGFWADLPEMEMSSADDDQLIGDTDLIQIADDIALAVGTSGSYNKAALLAIQNLSARMTREEDTVGGVVAFLSARKKAAQGQSGPAQGQQEAKEQQEAAQATSWRIVNPSMTSATAQSMHDMVISGDIPERVASDTQAVVAPSPVESAIKSDLVPHPSADDDGPERMESDITSIECRTGSSRDIAKANSARIVRRVVREQVNNVEYPTMPKPAPKTQNEKDAGIRDLENIAVRFDDGSRRR